MCFIEDGKENKLKNIIYILIVSLISGAGIYFVASGITQKESLTFDYGYALWKFDPVMIGIGGAFIVCAVLLYRRKT